MTNLKDLQKLFVQSTENLIKIIREEKVGKDCYFFSENMREECIQGTLKTLEDFKDCEVEEVLRQEIKINQAIEKDIIFNKSNNFASQRIQ
jgi:hypothetical protein